MLIHLFRKRSPTGFSIEKLFDALHEYVRLTSAPGITMGRMELPHATAGLWTVLKNAWYVRRHFRGRVLHITGDVHYGALLMPFTPTIITVHDCVVLQRGRGFKKFVLWLLWFRLPMTFAVAITVISEQTRRELLSVVKLPPEKVRVIPNFVGAEFQFTPATFNAALPRILHVGTHNNKNLPRVIEALSGFNAVLVIVGVLDEQQRTLLAQHALRFENHVTPGDAQLLSLYRSCDLVSFPSTYEGFGMPIVEAQATGRPVLTSDLEPMRSIAGAGAVLVDPLSVESIRNGFSALLHDPGLRERLIRNGLANARQYTLASVACQYQNLYEQVDG